MHRRKEVVRTSDRTLYAGQARGSCNCYEKWEYPMRLLVSFEQLYSVTCSICIATPGSYHRTHSTKLPSYWSKIHEAGVKAITSTELLLMYGETTDSETSILYSVFQCTLRNETCTFSVWENYQLYSEGDRLPTTSSVAGTIVRNGVDRLDNGLPLLGNVYRLRLNKIGHWIGHWNVEFFKLFLLPPLPCSCL